MSFGVSPSDILKLVEVSARVYVAFKNANDNSEAQVASLVREFSTFHDCLKELSELMTEYGKPLPFGYLDVEDTLKRCEHALEPYATNLVDRKMSVKKFYYTIKYIGKEKEIEGLRAQITGHYQAIQFCISMLQVRLGFETKQQTQRLLNLAPFRNLSFMAHSQDSSESANTLEQSLSSALPASPAADGLYKDWLVFSRWMKYEDERLAIAQSNSSRPGLLGSSSSLDLSDHEQNAAVLYQLRRELEDAIIIEENRAKRAMVDRRMHHAPSDDIREQVRNLPKIPQRLQPSSSDARTPEIRLQHEDTSSLSESTATVRPPSHRSSPNGSPFPSPQLPQSDFGSFGWHSPMTLPPVHPNRTKSTSSVSTVGSGWASPSEIDAAASNLGDTSTAGTSPEDGLYKRDSRHSVASLNSIALGPDALQWTKLCRKVHVERATSQGVHSRECDLHWRHREDGGISIRSLYRSGKDSKDVKTWITQHFPASGPSIPLTTTMDSVTFIDFPRASFGKLDKGCTNIKYTVPDLPSSTKLQTLLYTNSGSHEAELLYDRPVHTISSDLHKPECRGKNVRLWKTTECHTGLNGMETVQTLVLVYYTSALPDFKAHWVEEPHYLFQWLDDAEYDKTSEKLLLVVSKDPERWKRQKFFATVRRKSTRILTDAGSDDAHDMNADVNTLGRSTTSRSTASAAPTSPSSPKSTRSSFGFGRARPTMDSVTGLNKPAFSELDIRFQKKEDRTEFLRIWREYVHPL